MLNEHAQESLDGPQNHPMHHYRAMAVAVNPDVGQIKAFGKSEITLDGGALPPAIQSILQFDIDLRAVEGAFSLRRSGKGFPCPSRALIRAFVARSQSSSVPMDFSGRVLISMS